jgi:hypothetical protein
MTVLRPLERSSDQFTLKSLCDRAQGCWQINGRITKHDDLGDVGPQKRSFTGRQFVEYDSQAKAMFSVGCPPILLQF